MATTFKRLLPTLNRILVKKVEPVTKTSTGIILQKPQENNYGTIVEVGPGLIDERGNTIRLSVKVGDTVLLPEYGGTKVKLQNTEFFLYKDTDILGIMSN